MIVAHDRLARLPARGMMLVFGVLLALIAGCAQGECSADGDCALDQICQAGSCATRCETDDDCSSVRECRGGVCSLPIRCASAADCPAGEICEGGQCTAQTEECASSAECPPNFTCFEGGCYAPGTLPGEDAGGCVNCQNGEACIDGDCVPLDAGDAGDEDTVLEDADPEDTSEDSSPDDTDLDDSGEDADDTGPDDTGPDDTGPEDTGPEDSGADTGPDDTTPDTPEVEEDAGCTGAGDCGPGEACFGGECVPVSDTSPDVADAEEDVLECSGEGTRAFGELCTSEGQCCEPPCAAITPAGSDIGRGVCSRPCDTFADCNPDGLERELMCYTGGGIESQFCLESAYMNLCSEVGDCTGGLPGFVCRIPSFPGTGRCTWQCESNVDCRGSDSICTPVDLANGVGEAVYANLCVPVGTLCNDFRDCPSGLCLVDDEDPEFVPYCTAWCVAGAPNACPDGFACAPELNTPELPGFGACVFVGGS